MADVQVVAPNGQPGTIPEENLDEALKNGFTKAGGNLSEAAPDIQSGIKAQDIGPAGTYNVVTPTGEKGTVPTDQLPSALANGFKLLSQHAAENEHAAKVQYYVNDLKSGLATGHVNTFLRGYADEFLAGGAEKAEQWIADKLFNIPKNPDQQKEDQAFAEAVKQVNEEQSTTHTAGEVGGFLGQAYIGGKLAQAAAPFVNPVVEKAITNPLMQAAAKEAVAGAISVSPQAMAQAVINKDPLMAAESLAIGLGTGAIIGTAIKGLTKIPEAPAVGEEAAATVSTPLNTGEKLLLDHLNLTKSMRRNIGDADDQRRILTILAKELGEGDLAEGNRKMASMTQEDLAMEVKKLTAENGPRIGEIRSALDKAVEANPELRPPAITIAVELEKLKEGLVSQEEKNVIDHATKFLVDKGEEGGTFKSFTEADKVKNYFQDRVDWKASGADKAPNRVAANVARIVREHVEDSAQKIAEATQSPKIIEDWAHYKALYGVGKTLDLAADNTLNAPITNEFIPGGHGALGAGYLGHVIGSAAGVPVIGPVVGVMGTKMLKHYLREGGIAKAAYWLGSRIQEPAIHSYVAMDAVKSISERLEEIPSMAKSFVEAGAAHLLTRKPTEVVQNSIKTALGDEANGLSKDQQFERLAHRLSFMKANPETAQKAISELVEGVAQNHPQLAMDLSANLAKKMEYLYSILPKNPNQPMPFKHDVDWHPSPAEMDSFKKQLAVANDPFHALEELKAGTLTAAQVATLAVLNPDLLQKMRMELIKASQQAKTDNIQKIYSMSIMLAEKIDNSLMAIPQLQAAYVPPAGPAGAPPGKKGSKNAEIKGSKLPDYRLSFQKVLDKND